MPNIRIESDDHWHDLRNSHIGGSDVAGLFYEVEIPAERHGDPPTMTIQSITDPLPPGARPMACLSPYKTGYRLWLEKAGKLKPDFVDNERVDAGKFLEEGLAKWAVSKWPEAPLRKVRRYMTHPQIQGWGATLDYETVTGLRPVEFKNVDALIFKDQWGTPDDGVNTPPIHIMLQLQAQLGVSGKDEGDVIVCVGGNELKRATFKLHDETQIKIGKAIAEFWVSVALNKPPLAFADIDTASAFYRYGTPDHGVALNDPSFDVICRRILRLRRARARIETIENNLEGRIAAAMGALSGGAATKALTGGHRISWPVVVRPGQMYPAKWVDELTYRQGLRISEGKNGKRNR